MKQLVTGDFGTIYYTDILRNGKMSTNRIEMTNEAVDAVFYHMMSLDGWRDKGFAGYEIDKKKGGTVCLCLYDEDKWELVEKNKK